MLGTALREELKELIDHRQWDALSEGIEELEAADVAEIIEDLPEAERALMFRALPRDRQADVFELLHFDRQAALVEAISSEQIEAILNDMAPDDRTRLLEELPAAVVQRALERLHPDQLKVARRLLGYAEGTAGRVMTPEYVALPPLMTATQALSDIRKRAKRVETVSVIYLVDEKGRLIDDLDLSQIALAPEDSTLATLADGNFVAVRASEPESEVVRQFEKYDRFALPVVDGQGILVGIITADDVLDVAERAATEDIQKLGGSEALDAPYFETPLVDMVKKRGVWLSILCLGEMFTATAMAAYEHEIEKAVVLALFVPLIISSGGNSGSQATSIIIRAIALGEVSLKDWFRIVRRELVSGLALGGILGGLGFLRVVLWPTRDALYGPHWPFIATTVFLSLVGVVLFGSIVGSMLPLILQRLKLDPAAASAPFVATLVDVTGLVFYFSIASVVLRGTLL